MDPSNDYGCHKMSEGAPGRSIEALRRYFIVRRQSGSRRRKGRLDSPMVNTSTVSISNHVNCITSSTAAAWPSRIQMRGLL